MPSLHHLHLHLHLHSCKSVGSLNSSLPPFCFILPHKTRTSSCSSSSSSSVSIASVSYPKIHLFFENPLPSNSSYLLSCSSSNDEISNTHVSEKPEPELFQPSEELELRGKPSPLPTTTNSNNNGSAAPQEVVPSEPPKPEKDEALAPFLKFFTARDTAEEQGIDGEEESGEAAEQVHNRKKGEHESWYMNKEEVRVEYFEPKPGDFVVGVVVSGNGHKLDVNIGADLLATMLTKEVLPLYDKELPYLSCDFEKDAEDFMVRGKMGIVFDDDALSGEAMPGRPVVETGTILFAEVLGRTLSGRPLLSTRRLFRRVAWHRVRQIKQLDEPIEVKITEWNTGGLLTRIEGLRAFLPKAELMNKVNNFTDLKENVGRQIFVRICRIDEANNDLILSEREAWDMIYLKEGTLLDGTIRKIFTYGAQVRIGDTNRSGLLHISNITRSRVNSVSDLLSLDEKVKVLVVKSAFPDKISLSIVDLESEPGLLVTNKERVFSEAEEMAKKYRQKLPATRKLNPHAHPHPTDVLPFDNEEKLYANWKWFKFLNEGAN